MNAALVRRVLAIRSVPAEVVLMTAATSGAAQLVAWLIGWPFWAIAVVALLPWVPLFAFESAWIYRHYGWLALFYVLVVTQGGHFMEHVAQMVQIHVLGRAPGEAHGIIGRLDVEWVHFGFNTWVILAIAALLFRFRRNLWLWAAFAIAGWHQLEHSVIIVRFLETGKPGNPGLLSAGGSIGGGVGLIRPDLHFLYNVVETVPLVIAFGVVLKASYDEWLARALPLLSEPLLVETTNRLGVVRRAAGEPIIREGEPADRFYVVSRGEVVVTRREPDGSERELGRLGAGQYFGEIGLLANLPRTASVKAASDVELLALDRAAFARVVEGSQATGEDLRAVAEARLSVTPA